jgi:fucose 4-O-acetylase-like acetyltransferase
MMKGIRNWFAKAFHTSVLQDKRLQWVDYLRGIAIVLVVYRHALLGIERSNIPVPSIFSDANMIFYSFRMPLFFILSGIFISRSLAKKSVKDLIGIKFENLLYPYFIWATIQVSLQVIFGHFTNSNRGFVDFSYIFYHPRYLDQFWYLPALFNTTIIYILIKTRFRPTITSQMVFGLLLYFASPYFQRVSMISDWMEFYIFFAIGDACSRLFFQETSQRFFTRFKSLLLILPLFILAQLYYLRYDIGHTTLLTDLHLIKENYLHHLRTQVTFLVIALVGCITMFNISFLMQRYSIFSFLRVLGFHSLYIYVMHVIVTGFIRLVLPPVFGINEPVVLLLVGIFCGLTFPVIFYNLLIRDNVLWFLFSFRKKKDPKLSSKEVRPAAVISPTQAS